MRTGFELNHFLGFFPTYIELHAVGGRGSESMIAPI